MAAKRQEARTTATTVTATEDALTDVALQNPAATNVKLEAGDAARST